MSVATDPIPINITAKDIESRAKNISWSPLLLAEDDQVYTVTVRDGERNVVISSQLVEKYFVFNASDSAPACEVYNVSVTATYVGATYTGAGCSESSNETFMLPSLPDIRELEKSIKNQLMKEAMISLTITFKVSC